MSTIVRLSQCPPFVKRTITISQMNVEHSPPFARKEINSCTLSHYSMDFGLGSWTNGLFCFMPTLRKRDLSSSFVTLFSTLKNYCNCNMIGGKMKRHLWSCNEALGKIRKEQDRQYGQGFYDWHQEHVQQKYKYTSFIPTSLKMPLGELYFVVT